MSNMNAARARFNGHMGPGSLAPPRYYSNSAFPTTPNSLNTSFAMATGLWPRGISSSHTPDLAMDMGMGEGDMLEWENPVTTAGGLEPNSAGAVSIAESSGKREDVGPSKAEPPAPLRGKLMAPPVGIRRSRQVGNSFDDKRGK